MPLALLKLIPIKDWVYLSLIVALGLAFGAYTIHERHIGEAKIEQKDNALRAAATALNTASSKLAQTKETQIVHTFEVAIQAPPVLNTPGLVCANSTPSAVEPAGADHRPEADGASASRADDVFNPSGALRTDARDADAQINGLIDTVLVLEAELQGKTDGAPPGGDL